MILFKCYGTVAEFTYIRQQQTIHLLIAFEIPAPQTAFISLVTSVALKSWLSCSSLMTDEAKCGHALNLIVSVRSLHPQLPACLFCQVSKEEPFPPPKQNTPMSHLSLLSRTKPCSSNTVAEVILKFLFCFMWTDLSKKNQKTLSPASLSHWGGKKETCQICSFCASGASAQAYFPITFLLLWPREEC